MKIALHCYKYETHLSVLPHDQQMSFVNCSANKLTALNKINRIIHISATVLIILTFAKLCLSGERNYNPHQSDDRFHQTPFKPKPIMIPVDQAPPTRESETNDN